MLPSMSIKHTVRWQNLVAHLVAKGTPLRHILLDWFKTLWKGERASRRLKGSRGGGGGEHSNTAFIYFTISLRCPCMVGVVSLGPFHFLICLQGLPSSQKSPGKQQPQPAVTLTYFLFALLAGLLPLTSPPAPFSIALVL